MSSALSVIISGSVQATDTEATGRLDGAYVRWEAVRKKRVKSVMTLDHIHLFICKLFKRPAFKVKPADRWFLMMMIIMFFGMKRYDDIKQL